MSIKEAKIIIDEYGLNTDEDTIEIVLEVINKFGSAKNVIIEGLKPEYKFLKKLSKLLAMMDEKPTFDDDAEKIAKLMHSIYKVVSKDSQERGEDFLTLLRSINVRKTFNPSEMELWVMNHIGGRELIAKIIYQEPNFLYRKILDAIEMYKRLSITSPQSLQIENKVYLTK
jgi:hypothetical protein